MSIDKPITEGMQPTEFDTEAAQRDVVDEHTPIQEGVEHGPYIPTKNPYEQTDGHRDAVSAAAYTKPEAHIEALNKGLDRQEAEIQKAINSGYYDKLGTLAGPAQAESDAISAVGFHADKGEEAKQVDGPEGSYILKGKDGEELDMRFPDEHEEAQVS